MFGLLSYLLALSNLVYLVDSTSEERFLADTRSCNWEPWVRDYDTIFHNIETMLHRSSIHISDIDSLYRQIHRLTLVWSNIGDNEPQSRVWNAALTLLNELNGIENRDCFDICTYVLAKNCCKSGRQQRACSPRSRTQYFIKSIVNAKVFPMIERCQASLMYNAIVLNTSLVEPNLYAQVSTITELMTAYQSGKFNSIEKIALTALKPYSLVRASIRPASTGFFEHIFDVMLRIEKVLGENGLEKSILGGDFGLNTGYVNFERLILNPCNQFIQIMRTAMDPSLYYGSVIDLDKSIFQLDHMSANNQVGYFRLLQRFQACVWLNNHEAFELDWPKLIQEFVSRASSEDRS